MPSYRQQLLATKQLLRIKPVMSWGLSAFLLGAALAYARVGADINIFHGGLAIATVLLAQGIVSHGLNDAYDWITGTDRESIGKGTGGSRVIPEGKMSLYGVITTAILGLVTLLAIGGYFIYQYGLPMVVLFGIAVWSPVAYSTPPLKLGYRPFSELTVVLPALVGVVVGTDLVLSGSWSWLAVGVGLVHAFFCMSWFIVSRIPDYKPDKKVGKVTTVVWVGLENSRFVSWVYLTLAGLAAVYMAYTVSPVFLFSLVPYVVITYVISTLDPFNPNRASNARLSAMHLTTANAVSLAWLFVYFGL